MSQVTTFHTTMVADKELHMYYGPGLSMYDRKIKTLLKVANVECKSTKVDVMNGEHKTKYAKELPNNATPTLREGEYALTGSDAIMRYLAGKHAPELYPAGIRARGKVDMALDVMTKLEAEARNLILAVYFKRKDWPVSKTKEDIVEAAKGCLTTIQDLFCKEGEFMTGPTLTIADLALYTLVMEFTLTEAKLDVSEFTRLSAWLERVEGLAEFAGIDEVNKDLTDCCKECLEIIEAGGQ
eukprot:482123_1